MRALLAKLFLSPEWEPVAFDEVDYSFRAVDMVVAILRINAAEDVPRWKSAQSVMGVWRRENPVDMYMLLLVPDSGPLLDLLNEAVNDRTVCRKIIIVANAESITEVLLRDFPPCRPAGSKAIDYAAPLTDAPPYLKLLEVTPPDEIANDLIADVLVAAEN